MSMPQGGESGQSRETGQQTGPPGQQWQSGTPGQSAVPGQSGPAGQGGIPSQADPTGQWGPGAPQGQGQYQYGMPPQGGAPGQQWGSPMAGQPISPVNEIETRVTGRRVVQYIIDIIIYGVVASLISWALTRNSGVVLFILWVVSIVLIVGWYLLYWAAIPARRNGQTLGMSVMGIRVININGGPASFGQLAGRSILLILFGPAALLVGFIVMMCSRYRQRTGDHMARTMVVRAQVQPMPAQQEYVGAQRAG
jgi:uncharacterized RDD family membrane protein YckC